MDTADDSLVTFYGPSNARRWRRRQTAPSLEADEIGRLRKLGEFKLDEDVGSGRIVGEDGVGTQEVAPWLSIQKSITAGASVNLMYIVYHTSEYETLVGGLDADGFAAATESASPPKILQLGRKG